ncbi:MAG TPA: hypothetical protein PL173_13045 [Saprospiraceae bacterium]|nr:hypothetical protein [Saprospiraceae bacterium]
MESLISNFILNPSTLSHQNPSPSCSTRYATLIIADRHILHCLGSPSKTVRSFSGACGSCLTTYCVSSISIFLFLCRPPPGSGRGLRGLLLSSCYRPHYHRCQYTGYHAV